MTIIKWNVVKDSAGSLRFLCYVNLFILLRSIPQHDNGISSKPHVMSECLNSALNSASSFCFCASYAGIHRTGLRRFSFTWVACGNLKSLSGSNTSYTTVVMVQISLKSKKKKKIRLNNVSVKELWRAERSPHFIFIRHFFIMSKNGISTSQILLPG